MDVSSTHAAKAGAFQASLAVSGRFPQAGQTFTLGVRFHAMLQVTPLKAGPIAVLDYLAVEAESLDGEVRRFLADVQAA
jgi:hypothetical protein